MTSYHFLLYLSTYFSLGVDVVTSFHMKRENLHELILRQDVSGCKKFEITYVKYMTVVIHTAEREAIILKAHNLFSTPLIFRLIMNSLLSETLSFSCSSASLFKPCVTNTLPLWPSRAMLSAQCAPKPP